MTQHPKQPLIDPVRNEIGQSRSRKAALLKEQFDHLKSEYNSLKHKSNKDKEALMHQIADLENLLKAKEREFNLRTKNAEKDLIRDLLPLIDSLEAGKKANDKDSNLTAFRDMILNILKKHGLNKIETIGKRFDPFKHEVVGVTDKGDEGIVQEEIQDGYMVNEDVIRTAKVIVSKGE